ncbi:hypothetical protein C2E23DRAFT_808365, partial [Lenzites betulinus]
MATSDSTPAPSPSPSSSHSAGSGTRRTVVPPNLVLPSPRLPLSRPTYHLTRPITRPALTRTSEKHRPSPLRRVSPLHPQRVPRPRAGHGPPCRRPQAPPRALLRRPQQAQPRTRRQHKARQPAAQRRPPRRPQAQLRRLARLQPRDPRSQVGSARRKPQRSAPYPAWNLHSYTHPRHEGYRAPAPPQESVQQARVRCVLRYCFPRHVMQRASCSVVVIRVSRTRLRDFRYLVSVHALEKPRQIFTRASAKKAPV